MKTRLLVGIMICCVSVPVLEALADQGGEGQCGWTDQNGGQVQGQEDFEARVALAPTDNGPAGASGWAKIEAENEEGSVAATLTVSVQGLPDGDYSAVVTLSDGSQVTVGQFTLAAGQGSTGENGEDNGPEHGGWGSAFQAQLPDSVNPTDITTVTIVDANNNAVLTGDVGSNNSSVQYKATVRLKAGSSAPRANGHASVSTTILNGKAAGRFSLSASGVPANSTLLMSVNGKVVGRARSSPKGNVLLQNIPSRQRAIRSIELKALHGRPVVGAHF